MANSLVKANNVSFPLVEKTLYANEGARIIQSWIHQSYGGWFFDDKNNTDFPEATTNLVSGQVDYALPVDSGALLGVSFKDSSGVWNKLIPITLEQIQDAEFSESEFLKTNSTPMYYRPLAKSIKIYPAANFNVTSGLKIYESRDISSFASTDTTKTPGFDSMYHEALPTFMAFRYAQINQLPNKNDLEKDWLLYEQRIKQDYSRRFAELFPPRITVRDITRDYE